MRTQRYYAMHSRYQILRIEMDSNYNPSYDGNKIHIFMKIQQDY